MSITFDRDSLMIVLFILADKIVPPNSTVQLSEQVEYDPSRTKRIKLDHQSTSSIYSPSISNNYQSFSSNHTNSIISSSNHHLSPDLLSTHSNNESYSFVDITQNTCSQSNDNELDHFYPQQYDTHSMYKMKINGLHSHPYIISNQNEIKSLHHQT
jgi:hypothetical protein